MTGAKLRAGREIFNRHLLADHCAQFFSPFVGLGYFRPHGNKPVRNNSLFVDFVELRDTFPFYIPDLIPVRTASLVDVVVGLAVAIAENYFEK